MIDHPAAGWRIRAYVPEDALCCVRVFDGCFDEFAWRGARTPHVDPLLTALEESFAWVAEEPNAGIVGFLTMIPERGYVEHLFVDADWRLCGIGRGLLETARLVARRPLTLTVDAENRRAREAYAALGWSAVASGGRGARAWLRLVSP